jgi:hypothetical protein
MGPAYAASLLRGPLAVIGEIPSRDTAGELGRAIGREDGDSVHRLEALGLFGRQRSGAGDDGDDALEICARQRGFHHHAQRRGDEAHRRRSMTSYQVAPDLDVEALEERDPAPVGEALQGAPEPADVDERGADDGNTGAESGRLALRRLIMAGAEERLLDRAQGELDSLRRPRRAAGEHLDGDARARWMVRDRRIELAAGDLSQLFVGGHLETE